MNDIFARKNTAIEIIEFWKMTEFLSQVDIAKEKEENRRQVEMLDHGKTVRNRRLEIFQEIHHFKLDVSKEIATRLSRYAAFSEHGKTASFCIGRIKRNSVMEYLLKFAETNYPEQVYHEDSEIAWFSFSVDAYTGIYKEKSFQLSTLLWAVHRWNRCQKTKKSVFSLNTRQYERLVNAIDRHLKHKKPESFLETLYETIKLYVDRIFPETAMKPEKTGYTESVGFWEYAIYQEQERSLAEKLTDEYVNYADLGRRFFDRDLLFVSEQIKEQDFGNKTAYEKCMIDYILAASDSINPDIHKDVCAKRTNLLSHDNKIKQFSGHVLSAEQTPLGKWPSDFAPNRMQQLAINLAMNESEESPVFSVNGPPGSGKSTLLKEIVAGNIVKRTKLLTETIGDGAVDDLFECEQEYFTLRNKEINRYGMLFASGNNVVIKEFTENLYFEEGEQKYRIGVQLGTKHRVQEFCRSLLNYFSRKCGSIESRESHKQEYDRLRRGFDTQYKHVLALQSGEKQASDLCLTKEYDREREKLFMLACKVNGAFVKASYAVQKNMKLFCSAVENKNSGLDSCDMERAFPSLFQTLFLVMPVISTTLASVQNFLGSVKKKAVFGMLILDEAGQLQPHTVLGALMRCQRAVIVGDPKQIEPVVMEDASIIRTFLSKPILQPYMDKTLSVQSFANYINPFGAYLTSGNQEEWVGSPLVEHRRCIEPMFSIANRLSYCQTMKKQTALPGRETVKTFLLKKSCWIHVSGKEAPGEKNHFVSRQGDIVLRLLAEKIRIKKEALNKVFVITPFASVAAGLKKMIAGSDLIRKKEVEAWLLEDHIGTVHTFQGKEADEVIFVLGCDYNSVSAAAWVNCNIVNVAATRAKYRFYMIGDKEVWKTCTPVNTAREIIEHEITDTELCARLDHSETIVNAPDFREHFPEISILRGEQAGIIRNLMKGKDVLAIRPTGEGKSVCFQYPAYKKWREKKGITIVVEPLIALMKDQEESLRVNGIPAVYMNRQMQDYERTMDEIAQYKYALVYVSPETLVSPWFLSTVNRLQVAMIVVDEAHCISLWGHSFRQSYLRIAQFVHTLEKRPQIAAFTATASMQMTEEIRDGLGLKNEYRPGVSFNRSHIILHMRYIETYARNDTAQIKNRLIRDLRGYGFLQYVNGVEQVVASGIIYCQTIEMVNEMCYFLRGKGYAASVYYSKGMTASERQKNMRAFMNGDARIMVCTNAFGMGIDKRDIRFVMHVQLPVCMEDYYQETGRAGRDGNQADCFLYVTPRMLEQQKKILEANEVSEAEYLQHYMELIRGRKMREFIQQIAGMKQKKNVAVNRAMHAYLTDYFEENIWENPEETEKITALIDKIKEIQRNREKTIDQLFINTSKAAMEIRKGRYRTGEKMAVPVGTHVVQYLLDTELDYLDLMIADAVYTLECYNVKKIYPRNILQLLSGNPDVNPKPEKTREIINRINKMMHTGFKVGKQQEMFLPLRPCGNPDNPNGYMYQDMPLLYRYAQKLNGQFFAVDQELLCMGHVVKDNEETLKLKHYIVYRILLMKQKIHAVEGETKGWSKGRMINFVSPLRQGKYVDKRRMGALDILDMNMFVDNTDPYERKSKYESVLQKVEKMLDAYVKQKVITGYYPIKGVIRAKGGTSRTGVMVEDKVYNDMITGYEINLL